MAEGTAGPVSAAPPAPGRVLQGLTIARYALRESVRRRVVPVITALTVAFLVLYGVGTHFAFEEVGGGGERGIQAGIDDVSLAGATLLGLAMFGTLFLGAIVATFLTLGAIRGDAESGLLQPIAARPVGRATILIARFAGAALAAMVYSAVVFAIAIAITGTIGDFSPDRPLAAILNLVGAVAVITCISVLASAFASSTAQGIAVLMLFGAGLVAGLLGQIGDALGSDRLVDISDICSRLLPFEALYQDGLYSLTAEISGTTGFLLSLGPFGGAVEHGLGLVLFTVAYCAALLAIAAALFGRRDL